MSKKRNTCFDNLLQYVSLGQNDMAELMLSEELCKVVDDTGTLLHYAVGCGNSSIISKLLKLGSEIDSLDSSGKTPLMIAVENQHVGIVNILLNANANVDIVGPNGVSALGMIFNSQYGNHYIHEAFLLAEQSKSSSIGELVDRLYNAGCLAFHAVFCRNADVIDGLLKRGVDVNSICSNRTALHMAASRNELQLVKILVQNGADVNAIDGNGSSALLSAALNSNDVMLKFLLDEGADINIQQPSTGWTALFLVYQFSSFINEEQLTKCAEILMLRGAVPRNAIIFPFSILDIADDKHCTIKSKLLISYLAMQEALGFSVIESLTGSSIDEYRLQFPRFGKLLDNCQNILNTKIFKSMTLLDLLTESENRMVIHARNDTFLHSLAEFYSEHFFNLLYPLFFKMLEDRVHKAVQKMNLENKSIPIICNIFEANCYLAARNVVTYLSERDLEQLNSFGDLMETDHLST